MAQHPKPGEIETMEARLEAALPDGDGWQFEPKWDGFRCLAFRDGATADLRAKSGKPLGRYFPEVVQGLLGLAAERFVLDGELVIPVDGNLSFDALQMRLHPAESRIRKLSQETPARLVLFDLLAEGEDDLLEAPFEARRGALERFFKREAKRWSGLRLTPFTRAKDEAEDWLAGAGGALDGVVAKRLDLAYQPGERAMVKVKRMRTADCVVGGFRYGEGSKLVGSLLLGLHDEEGRLNHVGFTSSIAAADKPALTKQLEVLAGGEGFTGKAPGGPSRWSTDRSAEWVPLRPELVVEVRYDHVSGDRLRHGAKLLRWRPDKSPRQCTMEQLESAPDFLAAP